MKESVEYHQGDAFVNSIIGEGTTLRGEFELNGLLRIDGRFFGKIITSGKVLVGKSGTAECVIVAGTVVVGGKVKGEVIATEGITLLSTGVMIGAIKTPHLVIEEGVTFDGHCEVIENKEEMRKIREEYIESQFGIRGSHPNELAGRKAKKVQIDHQLTLSGSEALEKEESTVT